MAEMQENQYISKRSPHGVGKQMIGCKYIHISAVDTLPMSEKTLVEKAIEKIGPFSHDIDIIVKICIKESQVSFIESPDWKTASEPSIGYIRGFKGLLEENQTPYKRAPLKDPQIYHHKWMFVKDDYQGFDVKESMKWSEYWENHPEVIRLTNDKSEGFRSKIGNQSYWQEKVLSKIKQK